MNTTSIILLVILIVVIVKARRGELGEFGRWKHRDDDTQQRELRDPRREAELEREIRELHERIKVLERIATEDRSARDLSDEIDRLRDR
ncbi:conserved hypothetical protein [Altererythrobacter sp. B11]|uniref:hypothetical protein n=1 Tax=Altererythrobacter sp. B11 TaxID=2060312 RepID=UPI000DC6D8EB|nr:hypothetical protein [Altererythrobacter sp. B11]BBC74063.1 conserved hypothetical protein [Altererythrobacter sp. B11]